MSKEVTLFGSGAFVIPKHIAELQSEFRNIDAVTTVPSLTYEGRTWSVNVNGQKTRLVKRDENGDEVAMPVMRVVVLDYNKRRGRAYFTGAFDPANTSGPACWSNDGIMPDKAVAEPQAHECANCPMAAKGSRVTEQNRPVAACGQFRLLAVAPLNGLGGPALKLKLAVTSDYDETSPDMAKDNYFAWQQYKKWLQSRNVVATNTVVTKLRFDPKTTYPKVMFQAERFLDDDEAAKVRISMANGDIGAILGGNKLTQPVSAPAAQIAPKVVDDLDEDGDMEIIPPPKAEPKAAPKAAPKPAQKVEEPKGDIDALLGSWDDDE